MHDVLCVLRSAVLHQHAGRCCAHHNYLCSVAPITPFTSRRFQEAVCFSKELDVHWKGQNKPSVSVRKGKGGYSSRGEDRGRDRDRDRGRDRERGRDRDVNGDRQAHRDGSPSLLSKRRSTREAATSLTSSSPRVGFRERTRGT